MVSKYNAVDRLKEEICKTSIRPEDVNPYLESVGSAPIENRKKIAEILTRPFINIKDFEEKVPRGTFVDIDGVLESCGIEDGRRDEIVEAVEIAVKYQGYIDREKKLADKILRLENIKIPEDYDFSKITALSIECRIKLDRYRPRTIAQASRISGVSPADISVLLVHFGR